MPSVTSSSEVISFPQLWMHEDVWSGFRGTSVKLCPPSPGVDFQQLQREEIRLVHFSGKQRTLRLIWRTLSSCHLRVLWPKWIWSFWQSEGPTWCPASSEGRSMCWSNPGGDGGSLIHVYEARSAATSQRQFETEIGAKKILWLQILQCRVKQPRLWSEKLDSDLEHSFLYICESLQVNTANILRLLSWVGSDEACNCNCHRDKSQRRPQKWFSIKWGKMEQQRPHKESMS